jgi:exodeoxyribonuclease VII large subunit
MSDFPLFDAVQSPGPPKVCTVTEITRQIQRLIDDGLGVFWVVGEIAEVKIHRSGHLYLTLKDATAQLKAVIWRSTAEQIPFELHTGLEVIARGRLSVYAPQGIYQLAIDTLQPKGMGAHDLALRQLKQKLEKLGYFAAARKKPLPRFPRRIALVTSPSGAAIRDMLEILGRRWPIAQVLVCPVRVQGDGAAYQIAESLRCLNRLRIADVLILGRGGGSREDLVAFNQEIVARAIFESRIPIVSAVGHEIDVTLADLVADRRALTPSEAAEIVTPDRMKVLEGIERCEQRLRELLVQQYRFARRHCDDLAARKPLRLPLERIHDLERRLDDVGCRLDRALDHRRERSGRHLDTLAARLEALSPLNVLARGYTLTRKESDQSVVRRAVDVRPGERLMTLLQQGRIMSRVEECISPKPQDESSSPGG